MEDCLEEPLRASATAAAMEGWSWDTTLEVMPLEEDPDEKLGEVTLEEVKRGAETTGAERKEEGEDKEEEGAEKEEDEGEEKEEDEGAEKEEEPRLREPRACWMAGCSWERTSPTTCLWLICGAA